MDAMPGRTEKIPLVRKPSATESTSMPILTVYSRRWLKVGRMLEEEGRFTEAVPVRLPRRDRWSPTR